MKIRAGLLALLIFATDLAVAAPDAVVEGIQMPAWVTRDGVRKPLGIGAELQNEDRVSTGTNSRLLLRLGDGSTVKLGENGELLLSNLVQRREENFLGATLKVLGGAFRFTTDVVTRVRSKREIDVRFAALTAGIRGTDIWGKNLGDREVLVLIEGQITVTREGDAPVEMKDPLTYLQAPQAGPTSIEPVPMEQLALWAAETEIAAGEGAVRRNGRWKLYLGSYDNQDDALALYDELRDAGYPARILPRPRDGGQEYRVRIAGFPSAQEARTLGARLRNRIPGLEPVASRY